MAIVLDHDLQPEDAQLLNFLLQKWADLESDRCAQIETGFRLYLSRSLWFVVAPIPWQGSLNYAQDLALTQFAVHEAIDARKMNCVMHRGTVTGRWEVIIERFAMQDRPAIALLKAYINYLQP